jgi:hypothetical protein
MGWDGPDWERRAIATLDSAMNDFVDTIPPHRMLQLNFDIGSHLSMQFGGIPRIHPKAHSSTNPPFSM